jgi:hypothetical protein
MSGPTTLAATGRDRPGPTTLFWAWAAGAGAASLVLWVAGDMAFYNRFGLQINDIPSWRPWSALQLGSQAFGWAVMAALSLGWRRRQVVVVATVAVLAVGGLAVRAWAHHEADRAWAGAQVWPAAVLPFEFSARSTTMIPRDGDHVPEGVPSQGLLLRYHPDQAVVYDPASHQTYWIGNKIALPVWTTPR